MLIERVLGESTPISIGSSFPVETIMKLDKPLQTHVYLNVRTLTRNFLESYPDGSYMKVNVDRLHEAFVEELESIESILDSYEVVFYFCDTNEIAKQFTYAKIKVPSTPKQKDFFSLETKLYVRLTETDIYSRIKQYKLRINADREKAFIITSFALDLVSRPQFDTLTLVDSHTGTMREHTEWMRKVHTDPIWHNVPFNIMFIMVLGDRSNQLSSMGVKISKPLKKFAIDKKWKAYNTKEKLEYDIKQMPDPMLSKQLLVMLRTKIK